MEINARESVVKTLYRECAGGEDGSLRVRRGGAAGAGNDRYSSLEEEWRNSKSCEYILRERGVAFRGPRPDFRFSICVTWREDSPEIIKKGRKKTQQVR